MAKRWTGIQAIAVDLEGTVLPISFVTDTLYPFARQRLEDFLAAHRGDPEVETVIEEIQQITQQSMDHAALLAQLFAWMAADQKIGPLKTLQGWIWAQGYASGELQTPFYPDAAERLQAWYRHGVALYIYSSGSAYAQDLIVGHTQYGDLRPCFRDFFDTRVGHKRAAAAYRQISQQTGYSPSSLLFLSDVRQELDAARQASWQTAWVVRQALPALAAAHPRVANLWSIRLD